MSWSWPSVSHPGTTQGPGQPARALCRQPLELGEDRLKVVERPVEIGLFDHQRWGEPQRRLMGLLGEHAALHELLADRPCLAVEFDTGPQPPPPHLADAL